MKIIALRGKIAYDVPTLASRFNAFTVLFYMPGGAFMRFVTGAIAERA